MLKTPNALFLALCTVLVAAEPALAAENKGDDSKPSEKREADREPSKPKVDKSSPMADLTHCKREARGMDGPDRAKFMTDCLKRN